MRNLRANNGATNVREFVPLQLVAMTLAGTVVWVAALRATVRRAGFDVHRWLAVGWLILFVVLFATEGKGYYLGSWYLPLVALGAVVIERTWSARAECVLFAAVVVTGLAMAPLFTPILPERTFVAAGLKTREQGPRLADRMAARRPPGCRCRAHAPDRRAATLSDPHEQLQRGWRARISGVPSSGFPT